jgi:hypothetical protein
MESSSETTTNEYELTEYELTEFEQPSYNRLPDDIITITKIKQILDNQTLFSKNQDYLHIYNSIKDYCKKYCKHNIITDTIDITPDRSQTIRYCSICLLIL